MKSAAAPALEIEWSGVLKSAPPALGIEWSSVLKSTAAVALGIEWSGNSENNTT